MEKKDEILELFKNAYINRFNEEFENIIRASDKMIVTTKRYIFIYDIRINDAAGELNYIETPIIRYLESLSNEDKTLDDTTKIFIKELMSEEYNEDAEGFFEIIGNNLIFFQQDSTISLNDVELIKSTIEGCA